MNNAALADYCEAPGLTERQRAERITEGVRLNGVLIGWRGPQFVAESITLQRLADHGVPPMLVLPFDTDSLRELIQFVAQVSVD